MLALKNWCLLTTMFGEVYAVGIVSGHPRLEDGDYIHTSQVMQVHAMGADKFVLETRSGSLYQVEVSMIQSEQLETTQELIKAVGISESDTALEKKLKEAAVNYQTQREARKSVLDNAESWAINNLGENRLYLIMEGTEIKKAIYKDVEGIHNVAARVHVGMMHDSVLTSYYGKTSMDFRYFPEYCVRPYLWAGDLEEIIIHNLGISEIKFAGKDGMISCNVGSKITIPKSVYDGSGLISG